AKLIQHQLAPIFELNRQPIPSALFGFEKRRAEFVVHPAFTADLDALAIDRDGASRWHSRERVIVRGVAGLHALLADALEAIDNRRLALFEHELDTSLVAERPQHV